MLTNEIEIFEKHRGTLEGLAYRMLGTLAEAQDAVQETYLKWHKQEIGHIDNHRAWLITVCTRISLNQLKLSYKQREVYVGEWLPEPLFQEFNEGMEAEIEFNESLTIALLHVLEKLSPTERAVFLLHDVFDMKFREIAPIVDKSTENCRQIAKRARKQIRHGRPKFVVSQEEHRRLLDKFITAAQALDSNGLLAILATDVELYSDGGGKVEALPHVLCGKQNIVDFLSKIFINYMKENVSLNIVTQRFNSSIGLLIFENGLLTTALTIECDYSRILRIYAVRNPDKLLNSPG